MSGVQPSPVMSRRGARIWLKLLLCCTAVLLAAAWIAPKISADRYREPVRAALEKALGRPVEFSEVKFRVLPLPGFTLTNLIVSEDPKIGAEPAAYVDTVRAFPRVSGLFTGAFSLSSVDLEGASVTLTRVETRGAGVRWNFNSVAASVTASGVALQPAAAFPSIHLRSGRINFKFGDTKSIFYLLNTDLDLWPPSSGDGPWTIRVHAQPARTDRRARGFGYFSARGQWAPRGNSVTLDVRLEQSEFGDMLTLFEGHESGVLGQIHGDAHLAGPIDRIGVRGRLTIENIHGWDESPPGGNAWPVWLSGYVNARGQFIDLRAMLAQNQSPLDIRYRISDYLGRPQWGITAFFTHMPVAPLVQVARNLGIGVPANMKITGAADGAASLAMPNAVPKVDGQIAISDLAIAAPNGPALRIEPANIRLAENSISIGPAILSDPAGEIATISAAYNLATGEPSGSIATSGLNIASLRPYFAPVRAPLITQISAGTWSGNMSWSGAWTGEVRLSGAEVQFEAFAEPIHVASAEVSINGEAINVRHLEFFAAGMEGSGEYRYEPGSVRPHRFRLNIPRADAAALEKLFSPTLRRGNFLNYALNFGRPPQPEWLTAMRADGTVQVSELDFGPIAATRLRSRVLWDGPLVRFMDVQSTVEEARFAGSVAVDLSQRAPQYVIPGAVTGLPWRSGTVDLEGEAGTWGFGSDLLSNLHAFGSFHGRTVELGGSEIWDRASGCFEWAWSPQNERLKLTQLVLAAAGDVWLGSAETRNDGRLVLNLSDGARRMQLTEVLSGAAGLQSAQVSPR